MLEKAYEDTAKSLRDKEGHSGGRGLTLFRASEGGSCRRRMAYARVFKEPEPTPSQLLLFQDGHLHHKDMASRLGKKFEVTEQERRHSMMIGEDPQITIRGHPDLIIRDPELGRIVIELKTVNHFRFSELTKMGDCYPDHRKQCLMYMWLTGLHMGRVFYKNKNTSSVFDVPIEWDGDEVLRMLKGFLFVAKALQSKKLPPRDRVYGSKDCAWCPFSPRCWKNKVKAPLRENPRELKRGRIDLSGTSRGKKLRRVCQKYWQMKASEKKLNNQTELIRARLLRILDQLKAKEVVAGDMKISRNSVERVVPDKKEVDALVEEGAIRTEANAYWRLDVEEVKK